MTTEALRHAGLCWRAVCIMLDTSGGSSEIILDQAWLAYGMQASDSHERSLVGTEVG